MVEEVLSGLMDRHTAGRNVLVDLELALLSELGPEPPLVRRDRQRGTQLDHAVGALNHLQLCTGLVQVQSAADVGGAGDGGSRRGRGGRS